MYYCMLILKEKITRKSLYLLRSIRLCCRSIVNTHTHNYTHAHKFKHIYICRNTYNYKYEMGESEQLVRRWCGTDSNYNENNKIEYASKHIRSYICMCVYV